MKYCTIFSSNWLDKFQNQILNNSSINFNGLFGQIFLLFSTKKPPPFLASFAKQRSGVKLTSWNRTVKMRSVRKGPTYVQSSASSSGEQGATSQSTIFSRGFSVALSSQPQSWPSTVKTCKEGPFGPGRTTEYFWFLRMAFSRKFLSTERVQSCSFLPEPLMQEWEPLVELFWASQWTDIYRMM